MPARSPPRGAGQVLLASFFLDTSHPRILAGPAVACLRALEQKEHEGAWGSAGKSSGRGGEFKALTCRKWVGWNENESAGRAREGTLRGSVRMTD
jgi:hypothetical protein